VRVAIREVAEVEVGQELLEPLFALARRERMVSSTAITFSRTVSLRKMLGSCAR
jgi:hypothetical protein